MNRESRCKGLAALAKFILAKSETADKNCILIYPHVRADGDAYGSSFALAGVLEQLGFELIVCTDEAVSEQMQFLPYTDKVKVWPDLSPAEQNYWQTKQTVAVQVDSREADRLALRSEVYNASPVKIVIDHHISSAANTEFSFCDPEAGANVELIYVLILLLEQMSGLELINDKVALCLYTGLLTDTGGFSYDNTSPETLRIAAELLAFNIDVAKLNNHLFKEVAWKQLQIEARLIRKIELNKSRTISYLTVDREIIADYAVTDADLDAMPALLRNIKGVKVSLLLRETADGSIRGNLRSTGNYDVCKIAQIFGGGGHLNASGFTIAPAAQRDMDIKKIASLVVETIEEELNLGNV